MSTHIEKDPHTGVETTGHEWDGIRELDNPAPKWLMYLFYATIVWAIGYWVLYPAWPNLFGGGYTKGILGYSQREVIAEQMTLHLEDQAGVRAVIAAATPEDIRANPDLLAFALAGGRVAFGDNCAGCHGSGGAGNTGFPALVDDDWVWGGNLAEIQHTIQYGIRNPHPEARYSEMPKFGLDGILTRTQIADTAEYVLSLSDRATDPAAVLRGQPVFEEQCVACHGSAGEGLRELGAPRLSDAIWIYGGSKEKIVESITNSRFGVMPAWTGRLDESTIKQLTVYVHALGGGE
ncbi:MAG: cytochrome-c oxidase, cbb3-type subunit III [Alphaproteobacteria bacterium]|nr:cytochrome-c oxidase, cbb3-type subunit III [Alphaproteobacteria bacterium]MBU0797159.1 cytochrome-c oxidase, cbb3-type subunit III [Alphaproteobacteria bacterium]MBU0887170.1 cytochrome-c oxidase, cbb3-type subunit III [Alphaproteobacteria bacterium]MBU1814420.1 cytochrome-c oxidase, cbb3-type subunit III [Alphaproteobacteria bacterium]